MACSWYAVLYDTQQQCQFFTSLFCKVTGLSVLHIEAGYVIQPLAILNIGRRQVPCFRSICLRETNLQLLHFQVLYTIVRMNAMSCAGVYSGVQCKSFEAIHSKSLSILILLMSANVCQYICIEQLQLRNWQGKLEPSRKH